VSAHVLGIEALGIFSSLGVCLLGEVSLLVCCEARHRVESGDKFRCWVEVVGFNCGTVFLISPSNPRYMAFHCWFII